MSRPRLDDAVRWAAHYDGDSETVPPYAGVRAAIAVRRRQVRMRRTLAAAAALAALVIGGEAGRRVIVQPAPRIITAAAARALIQDELQELDAALRETSAALDATPGDELLQRRLAHLTAMRLETELGSASLVRRAATDGED